MAASRVGCMVVGGGVVGLSVAREFALRGVETIVAETARTIGSGISSRNSEVIHAGIYYPKDSLKARMCVEGKHRIYDYVADRDIPHNRCGKLIVATDDGQEADLTHIMQKAKDNGVDDLVLMSSDEVSELEPEVQCTAALFSPSTGIVDSHSLMLGLLGDIENHGGLITFVSPIIGAKLGAEDDVIVRVGGEFEMDFHCDYLVNCAGLGASDLAMNFDLGLPPPPMTYYAKGNYYALSGRSPFSRLVYPIPEKGTAGLGVHATVDLSGQTKFGPDVEWILADDVTSHSVLHKYHHENFRPDVFCSETDDAALYNVDPKRADSFYNAVRKYWPHLKDGSLVPDYSGIRPKLSDIGEPAADFRIDTLNLRSGKGGVASLYGIESPGLTSALAIGNYVAEQLKA